jgi:hypothetical protein
MRIHTPRFGPPPIISSAVAPRARRAVTRGRALRHRFPHKSAEELRTAPSHKTVDDPPPPAPGDSDYSKAPAPGAYSVGPASPTSRETLLVDTAHTACAAAAAAASYRPRLSFFLPRATG